MKKELETWGLLGFTARKNPGLEHCWKLEESSGTIIAVWLDADSVIKVQIMDSNGASHEHWLCQVLMGTGEEE